MMKKGVVVRYEMTHEKTQKKADDYLFRKSTEATAV
jgi:hypothetical protein